MGEEGNIVASSIPRKIIIMPPEEAPKPKLSLATLFKKYSKWTVERIRNDGPIRHPECSYHLVKDEHVTNGDKGKIPVWCTIHQVEFWPIIHNHFSDHQHGNGCLKCGQREEWTVERIQREGPLKHPECSYHLVRDEHITKGAKSKIPVWCTIHQEEFRPLINSHFTRPTSGCLKCGKREEWTVERIQREGPLLYPDCSYHLVKDEHITDGNKSRIPVWCLKHQEEFRPVINSHFSNRHSKGCRKCGDCELWTSERVRREGPILNPDYGYSQVTDDHVTNGAQSIIPITCMTHNILFQADIHNHFYNNTRPCPGCDCPMIWTKEKVQREGPLFHPAFLYNAVTDEHMKKGAQSVIPVWCTIHNILFWIIAINHLNKHILAVGCRKCSNRELWTAERVQIEGPRLHPEYGYHYVTDDDITDGYKSIIPVWCTIHEIMNRVQINAHFQGHTRGCLKCSNREGWDLERFLFEANLIHGDACDYSEIGCARRAGWDGVFDPRLRHTEIGKQSWYPDCGLQQNQNSCTQWHAS